MWKKVGDCVATGGCEFSQLGNVTHIVLIVLINTTLYTQLKMLYITRRSKHNLYVDCKLIPL